MPAPSLYVLELLTGTAGASHELTSSQGTGFVGLQPLWNSFFIKADRTTGVGLLTMRAEVLWFDAAGAAASPASTWVDRTIDADQDWTFYEDQHDAPADAVAAKQKFTFTPAASPMQHTVLLAKTRLGRTQVAADITSYVDGPSSASFAHSSAGVAESGEFTRNLAYSLKNAAGSITSGITWTYTVNSGTVNGFTSASGAQSISGSGSATFAVASLGTNIATVTITATHAGAARTKLVTLSKTFAAPPTGGGGDSSTSSQTSGFASVTSVSYTTISAVSPALSTTLGTGKTQINVTATLAFNPTVSGPAGSNNIEIKVQRDVGGVWTDVGSSQNTNPDAAIALDGETLDPFVDSYGQCAFTINDTGLTAGNTYVHRVQARYTTGSANHQPFAVTGSIVTSVP